MSKAACKCAEVECEECPEWIFTLADLIMCMMGLFVIMWVLKTAGSPTAGGQMSPREVEVIAKIKEAFGWMPDPKSTDPGDISFMEKLKTLREVKEPGEGGTSKLLPRGAEGDQPDVKSVREGKRSIVGTTTPFAAGQAVLTEQAKRDLVQILPKVKGYRNVFLVKGHAWVDDFPEAASEAAKSDLSIQRAQAVRDYLVQQGVAPDILRVYGSSIYEPVKTPAYTPEERQMNRRVEVESTDLLVPDLQDHKPPQKPVGGGEVKSEK